MLSSTLAIPILQSRAPFTHSCCKRPSAMAASSGESIWTPEDLGYMRQALQMVRMQRREAS